MYLQSLVQRLTDGLSRLPQETRGRHAAYLRAAQSADGGYAKATGSASGSTYHTFLVGLCYQLLGRELPEPAHVLSFIRSRQREDGGFVELAPVRRSGTNPTAAAVGVLQLVDGLTAD